MAEMSSNATEISDDSVGFEDFHANHE